MKHLCVWLFAVLVPFGTLLGCASGGGANASPLHIEAARVKAYHSIQDLNNDAIAVVRVTATSTRTADPVVSTPFTVTTVKVDQVLRGSVSGSVIKLRQLGSPSGNVVVPDEAPVVQPGTSYVLFLRRFTYGPGRDTDQYIPVGGSSGVFLDQGGTLRRLDPQSTDIPATISLTELQHQIAR